MRAETSTTVAEVIEGQLHLRRKATRRGAFSSVREDVVWPAHNVEVRFEISYDQPEAVFSSSGQEDVKIPLGGRHVASFEHLAQALTPGLLRTHETAVALEGLRKAVRTMGMRVDGDQITKDGEGGPLYGASASVETAGAIHRRVTLTRMALLGPFSFALKKKQDGRELYLFVEGEDFAVVSPVSANRSAEARNVAAQITTVGKLLLAEARAIPSSESSVSSEDRQPVSSADELRKFADLLADGLITASEFEEQKQRLLRG